MYYFIPYIREKDIRITTRTSRVIVPQGKLYRVPARSHEIEVVSGLAWATAAGRDVILTGGEKWVLPQARDAVLISALGRAPLVLNVREKIATFPHGWDTLPVIP